ncbi:MAG TPA: helix-turn-helix transcriptional regulator [Vicinamibacterales bacterium]|jgi:DNA-binding PadR family transcriptional regulator
MSPRPLPAVTHLQFLVLAVLRGGPRTGHPVRRALARHGIRRSGPAFYQMMARLEDAGFVAGEYDQKVVGGQIIKERRYTLTAAGETAWTSTRAFYDETIGAYGTARPRTAHA